jgi:hypothetical protein
MAAWLPRYNSFFPITGRFTNPAALGAYLAIAITIIWANWAHGHRSYLLGKVIITIAMLFILVQTKSRAAVVALVMSLIFLVNRKYWKPLIVGCILLVLLLWLLRPASVSGRFLIWKIALSGLFASHWIWGVGGGCFSRYYMTWQADWFRDENRPMTEQLLASDNIHAFNEPLRILVENGMAGVLLIIIAICSVYRHCEIEYGSSTVSWRILLCYGIFSLFSYPNEVFSLKILWPLFLGMCCFHGAKIAVGPKIIRFMSGVLLLVLITTMGFWCRLQYTQYCIQDYMRYYSVKDERRLMALYQSLNNQKLVSAMSNAFFLTGLYEDAIPYLEKAIKLQPSGETYLKLGDCYNHIHDRDAAMACYKYAEEMLPTFVTPKYNQLLLLRESGNATEMKEIATKILSRPSKVENTKVRRMKQFASECLMDE